MPVVKTGRSNVAGRFCSHIRTVSLVVPAAMSQVQRRHMRTRLNYLKQTKMSTKLLRCLSSLVKHFLVLRYRDQSNLAEMRNPLLCHWKWVSCILKCYSVLHRSVKLFQMKTTFNFNDLKFKTHTTNIRTSRLDHSFLKRCKIFESFSSIALIVKVRQLGTSEIYL